MDENLQSIAFRHLNLPCGVLAHNLGIFRNCLHSLLLQTKKNNLYILYFFLKRYLHHTEPAILCELGLGEVHAAMDALL